ncbi:hypothetical protein, partial [Tritonibacter sp. SIMBA_163]|uniref:hypothetical protein n=1 Tax=Tritonibacter sp. SIMBA_163 TaxID=3080868 RepID=UPI00398076A7
HIGRQEEEEGGLLSSLLGIGGMLVGSFLPKLGDTIMSSNAEGGILSAVYPGEKFYSSDYLKKVARRNGLPPKSGLAIAEMLRQKV